MATEIINRLKRENVILKIVIVLLCILLLFLIQKLEVKQYEQLGNVQSQSYLWEQSG